MTITRNGTDIELTPEELREAFLEKENEYYLEDIRSRYELPEDKIDDIIQEFTHSLKKNDNYGESYWISLEYAADKVGLKPKDDWN